MYETNLYVSFRTSELHPRCFILHLLTRRYSDAAGYHGAVVWSVAAAGVLRQLPRLQEARSGGAGANQSDTAPDSTASVVHAGAAVVPDGRHSAVRCHLHRAVLYSLVDLDAPVLLHVRLPFHCVPDLGDYVLGDYHCYVLLPIVQ